MKELKKPDTNKPVFKVMNNIAALRIEVGVCATCRGVIAYDDFKDALSRKEYGISGMCQTCQDSVFG